MNGIKPNFLSEKQLPQTYYETPNPYKNAPSCNVNLLMLSRYAKKHNKQIVQLTENEVNHFKIIK